MAVQYSTLVRNGWGDSWESNMGVSVKIRMYTGAQPANCAASEAGTLLVEFALASDWSANAGSGSKTLSSLPLIATAVAPGTAAHYRIYDSTGATCHEQGAVATSLSDMIVDNTNMAAGQQVQITGYTKTWPGA